MWATHKTCKTPSAMHSLWAWAPNQQPPRDSTAHSFVLLMWEALLHPKASVKLWVDNWKITQPALVDVHVCLIILIVSLVWQKKKESDSSGVSLVTDLTLVNAGFLFIYLFLVKVCDWLNLHSIRTWWILWVIWPVNLTSHFASERFESFH